MIFNSCSILCLTEALMSGVPYFVDIPVKGHCQAVSKLRDRMILEGVHPDEITFLSVLAPLSECLFGKRIGPIAIMQQF